MTSQRFLNDLFLFFFFLVFYKLVFYFKIVIGRVYVINVDYIISIWSVLNRAWKKKKKLKHYLYLYFRIINAYFHSTMKCFHQFCVNGRQCCYFNFIQMSENNWGNFLSRLHWLKKQRDAHISWGPPERGGSGGARGSGLLK